jgi:hypothetical protein
MKKIYLGLFIILLLSVTKNGNAQDTCRRIAGFSATIQNAQYGIMIPFWIGKQVSIAPAFDFQWGDKIGTDYAIGIIPKFYFSSKKLSPYLSLRGGFASFVPAKENDSETRTTDWIAGIAFGAEYFFDPRFSIGVELQGNFTKSDKNSMRFSNPGNWNFNLASMVSANVYFMKKKKK